MVSLTYSNAHQMIVVVEYGCIYTVPSGCGILGIQHFQHPHSGRVNQFLGSSEPGTKWIQNHSGHRSNIMLYDVISELILPYFAIVIEVISDFLVFFDFFFLPWQKNSSAAEQKDSDTRKTQAPTVSQQSPFLEWRCLGIIIYNNH